MSRRINRPEDRLVARYLNFRRRWAGRETGPSTDEAREVDLPWCCPECGDRSVAEADCDRCDCAMQRSAGAGSAYR